MNKGDTHMLASRNRIRERLAGSVTVEDGQMESGTHKLASKVRSNIEVSRQQTE
jgi:hypothetical protein